MSARERKKGRRPFVTALIVIFNWFGVSGVFGPLFASLSGGKIWWPSKLASK